jgi:hypothetical protein
MKPTTLFLTLIILGFSASAWAQESAVADTLRSKAVDRSVLPEIMASAIEEDSLQSKAALFFINISKHPLGKAELKDDRKAVKYLRTPVRMNRITLMYVPTGIHRFQTIYMKKYEEVDVKAGEIYVAMLVTTSQWPVPYAFVKEDRFGREYVPVLMMYINGEEAAQLIGEIKEQEVIFIQQ